jgi:hypothetical protein
MERFIVKYIRDNHNHIVGAVVAVGKEQVGWSLCRKEDRIYNRYADRTNAIEIATKRAFNPSMEMVPRSVWKHYENMIERSRRYFK